MEFHLSGGACEFQFSSNRGITYLVSTLMVGKRVKCGKEEPSSLAKFLRKAGAITLVQII